MKDPMRTTVVTVTMVYIKNVYIYIFFNFPLIGNVYFLCSVVVCKLAFYE